MENIEIIKLLCINGANPEAEKINGGRLIHVAGDTNGTESMKVLIKYCNVDLESQLVNDTTALYLAAAENGHIDVVRLLLDRASRQLASLEGADPFYVATEFNHYEIGKILIKYGANLNHQVRGSDKMSALHWAAMRGNIKFVRLILKSGDKPDLRLKSNGVIAEDKLRLSKNY